ncbi:MAG: hypothetical protein HQL33_01620 [Alphaproteobacteria bacterium]|nr:hypothetical protein [Alphaproteobacteria bacterium]
MAIDIASRLATIGKLPAQQRVHQDARAATSPADWAAVQESRESEIRLPGGIAFAREASSRQAALAYQTQANAVRGAFSLNEARNEARTSSDKRDERSAESRELAKGVAAYASSEMVVSGYYASRPYAGGRLDVMM